MVILINTKLIIKRILYDILTLLYAFICSWFSSSIVPASPIHTRPTFRNMSVIWELTPFNTRTPTPIIVQYLVHDKLLLKKPFSYKPHKTDRIGTQKNVVPERRRKYFSSIHNRVFWAFFYSKPCLSYPNRFAFQGLYTRCYRPAYGQHIQRWCQLSPYYCVFLYHICVLVECKDKHSSWISNLLFQSRQSFSEPYLSALVSLQVWFYSRIFFEVLYSFLSPSFFVFLCALHRD